MIEENIIKTEKFLIDLLEDTKKKSSNINNEANKFKNDIPFMIWPKEKDFKYPFLHCNHPIINRVWFNKCGFFLPEELHHFYADISLREHRLMHI